MIGGKISKQLTVKEEKDLFNALEIVSASDVAAMMGWSVEKVSVYAARGVLPDPVGRINGRPVWTKRMIERHKKARGIE